MKSKWIIFNLLIRNCEAAVFSGERRLNYCVNISDLKNRAAPINIHIDPNYG